MCKELMLTQRISWLPWSATTAPWCKKQLRIRNDDPERLSFGTSPESTAATASRNEASNVVAIQRSRSTFFTAQAEKRENDKLRAPAPTFTVVDHRALLE